MSISNGSSTAIPDLDNKQTESSATLKFLNYVPILILVLGTVGNTFSFLIFLKLGKIKVNVKQIKTRLRRFFVSCRQNNKRNKENTFNNNGNRASNGVFTVYIYLAMLALFDLSVLFFGLFNDWLTDLKIFNLKLHSSLLCKSISFFAFFSSHFSSWLLVVVSSIRLLAIYSPFQATNLTKTKNVKIVCSVLMVSLALFNMQLYWNMEIKEIDEIQYLAQQLKDKILKNSQDRDEVVHESTTPKTDLNLNLNLNNSLTPLSDETMPLLSGSGNAFPHHIFCRFYCYLRLSKLFPKNIVLF